MENFYSHFKGLPVICLIHAGAIATLMLLKWSKPTITVDHLDQVRDLVRGTITVKPESLFDAYLHFKKTPGVKILTIRQNIHKLQTVVVNFIYKDSFIGEMQFKFQESPSVHHSESFLYEIDRSACMIEILEALNKQAVWMSNNGLLTSQVELVMREQIQEKFIFEQSESPYPRGSVRDGQSEFGGSNKTYGGRSVINQDGGGAFQMIQKIRK